jgi:hypothetical protein
VITEAFLLAGKIPVPPDDYRFARAELEFKSSIRNPATFSVFAAFGDYFHGTRRDLRLSFESRHTPLIRTTLTHEINRISLPAGNIQIQISSASVNLNFSPEMQFASQIQYDNISRRLAYSGRFSWEYGYASEFFVAANQEYLGELDSLMPVASGLTVRVGSTFRF